MEEMRESLKIIEQVSDVCKWSVRAQTPQSQNTI